MSRSDIATVQSTNSGSRSSRRTSSTTQPFASCLASLATDHKVRPSLALLLSFHHTNTHSQGPFLDGNKIFVDHTYNTWQALKDRQSTGGTLAIDTLFFPLYSDAGSTDEQKKLRSEPWALSTDNTTDGYVLAGQYAVAVSHFSWLIDNEGGADNPA